MHFVEFRETNRFSHSSFNACPQGEVLPFNLLRIGFTHRMLFRGQVAFVDPPVVWVESVNAKRFQEFFER